MAENVFHYISRVADGTVTAKRFGKLTAAGKLDQCDTSGEDADGVIGGAADTTISDGYIATLEWDGMPIEVMCEDTVTAGEIVQTNANGKAITQTTGAGLGKALTTATNGIIEIKPLWSNVAAQQAAIVSLTDSTGDSSTHNDTLADGLTQGAAFTDNSTGSAGTTIAAGAGVYNLSVPVNLATVADGDVLTAFLPGHKFKILAFDAYVTQEVTTADKLSTLNLEIGTTNVTGGEIALTSANSATLGAKVAGAAVTATNTGSASDIVAIEAASTTAFIEGQVMVVIRIQNMDTADAVASLVARAEEARTDLTVQNQNDSDIAQKVLEILVSMRKSGSIAP